MTTLTIVGDRILASHLQKTPEFARDDCDFFAVAAWNAMRQLEVRCDLVAVLAIVDMGSLPALEYPVHFCVSDGPVFLDHGGCCAWLDLVHRLESKYITPTTAIRYSSVDELAAAIANFDKLRNTPKARSVLRTWSTVVHDSLVSEIVAIAKL